MSRKREKKCKVCGTCTSGDSAPGYLFATGTKYIHEGCVGKEAVSRSRPNTGRYSGVARPRKNVTLEDGPYGTYLLVHNDGRERHIQTDWDFPGVASNMGWVPCKKCGATDGTVDCAHKTASQMIDEARAFLDVHVGRKLEDPGYFGGEG